MVIQKNIRAAFVNRDSKFYNLKEFSCILPISVGQDYHEGQKFAATIKLINDNFKSCIVIICDSLQRHTLNLFNKKDIDQVDLHQYANQLGTLWLERNKNTIQQLSITYEISRWDDWMNHKFYKKQKQVIEEFYNNDEKFKLAILNSVNEFISRYRKKTQNTFNYSKIYSVSLEYFKEECTVMPLWVEKNIDFEVYPGKRPEALVVAHEYLVQPQNLLTWLRFRFRT